MDVNPVQQAIAPSQGAAGTNGASALSSDFETFLKMLTTQMENQDPLNPIESADFAVQLATFSSVEQQVQTNDLLRELTAGLNASGISTLAGWVGMEARVSGPAYFDGAPIEIAPSPDPASDGAVLIVSNQAGKVVSREAFPPSSETLLWAGVDNTGQPLPSGQYSFEVESLNAGEVTSTKAVEFYGLIEEARVATDGVEVVLAGGIGVSSAAVSALRVPQSTL